MATPSNRNAPSNQNAPFRWNQEPAHAGKALPDTPLSCSEIATRITHAIQTNPDTKVLGFEGQLTTFPCITQLQTKIESQGYKTVICFNQREAKEKIGADYSNPTTWHSGQYQVFVIKNRYKGHFPQSNA